MCNRHFVLFRFLIIVLSLFILFSTDLSAQDGRWVEYSLSGLGSGGGLYDRGDGLLGYTKETSQYFLVFDIGTGEWQQIDMGTSQSWEYTATQGTVLMAWSGEILLGYSALTQSWDTVFYAGTVLYIGSSTAGTRSYGCSDSLAFFATDEKLYVFDAAVADWQEYAITLPASYSGGTFWVKDDYVVLVLKKSESYSRPKNVVWSRHTQSFNEVEDGGNALSPVLDHGFVRTQSLDGTGDSYVLTGYSAFTNEFSIMVLDVTDKYLVGGYLSSGDRYDENTSYGLGFRVSDAASELLTCDFYGYDTYHGEWVYYPLVFDWDTESYVGNSQVGGQFVVDFGSYKNSSTGYFKYIFYSGVDGQFHIKSPEIYYNSTYYGFSLGGTVFVCHDTLRAWAYDMKNDRENFIWLEKNNTKHATFGEDWASFSRSAPDDDVMLLYFYNGGTNSWSTTEMAYETYSINAKTSPHYFMVYDSDNLNLIYYSSRRDEIITREYTAGPVYPSICGDMAYGRSADQWFVFDGFSGSVFEKNNSYTWYDLGTHSGIFAESDGTMHGYSALSGVWTEESFSENNLYAALDTGYVGLFSAYYGGNNYGKYYAYNGLADSWVSLVPEGTHTAYLVGERTAFIVRSTKIYAFDPERDLLDSDIEESNGQLPFAFTLEQNYPNPFNPLTTIEYALPRKADVNIEVYNLLGQRVNKLIETSQPAGKYEVRWDGTDFSGQTVASGIYFYRIKAGGFSDTKKMILLK